MKNNPKITAFEDLIAWKKGQDLAVLVYNEFKNSKDYGFKDQICRASVSVSNNIAEGFDRSTKKEFSRFLYIAKGSCAEVRSMMYLATRLGYSSTETTTKIQNLTEEIAKIIRGLLNVLNTEN